MITPHHHQDGIPICTGQLGTKVTANVLRRGFKQSRANECGATLWYTAPKQSPVKTRCRPCSRHTTNVKWTTLNLQHVKHKSLHICHLQTVVKLVCLQQEYSAPLYSHCFNCYGSTNHIVFCCLKFVLLNNSTSWFYYRLLQLDSHTLWYNLYFNTDLFSLGFSKIYKNVFTEYGKTCLLC